MEKNLSVPYSSQWDPDGSRSRNDCGPASIKMVLNFFGEKYTTDQLHQKTGAGLGLISVQQMINAIKSVGYNAAFEVNVTPQRLKDLVNQGIPPIVLVKYGSLGKTRQDQVYQSGHFMTVVGYRDDGYFVNDPNFYGDFRAHGDHHFYPKADFEKAWADCWKDQNPNNSLLIIWPNAKPVTKDYPVTSHQRNVSVITDNGLNVRTEPTTNSRNIQRTFAKGTSFPVEGFLEGEEVAGNNLWWKLKGENLFAWTGATSFIPKPEAEPGIANPNIPVTDFSKTELEANVQTLKEELNRVVKNSIDKDSFIENLKREKQNAEKEAADLRQSVGAEVALKTANEELSRSIEAYKQKIGELKEEKRKAYIQAFEGWDLFEFRKGSKGIIKSPLVVARILAILTNSLKNDYVLGYKKGGRLYKDGTGPLFDDPVGPVDENK